MGYSTQSIPFFSDEITIIPHTASWDAAKHIDRPVSIKDFAEGQRCSLEQRDDNNEYIARLESGAFIEGPEAVA